MFLGGSSNNAQTIPEGSHQLLSQLVRLGFLRDDAEKQHATTESMRDDNDADNDDSLQTFRQWNSHKEKKTTTDNDCSWDGFCAIIPAIRQDLYYTQTGLVKELMRRLDDSPYQGRASLPDLCRDLHVECETVFLSTFQSQQQQTASSSARPRPNSIWKVLLDSVTVLNQGGDMELVSAGYWERIAKHVVIQVEEEGTQRVVELSNAHNIPVNIFVEKVVTVNTSQLDSSISFLEESMTLVSNTSFQKMKQEVLKFFHTLEDPTQISAVCHENGWELDQVLDWLQNQEERNGEVHVDGNTHQTAVYIPLSYQRQKEQTLMDFLTTNGFVTLDRAPNRNMLKTLVEERFPDAFVIGDYDVIILQTVLEEARAGVSDYLASNNVEILELQDYLAAELVRSEVVTRILSGISFDDSQGVAVSTKNQAIVVRKNLVEKIEEKHLSQLVQDFARAKAQELLKDCNNDGDVELEDDPTTSKRGSKGKANRGRGGNQQKTAHDGNDRIVPLPQVVEAIFDAYPFFETVGSIPESTGWEEEDEDDEGGVTNWMIAFCRKAFYTPAFRKKCEHAVGAELKRLQSEKTSKATLSRKDAASKVRSVEAAFEKAFVTLCHVIQAQAKFITFASGSEFFDEESMETLAGEFLLGPCADLTSRITQQMLFKDEQDTLFTFLNIEDCQSKKEKHQIGLPDFCVDVDIAARSHPRPFLSCPPPRDPLSVLRESFSGNSGVALSRQWILCGGESYQGGTIKVADEEDETEEILHIRPGNVDGFMSHIEENALALCGLPFKKLDKKSEKNLFFSRKQQLTALLLMATDPTIILDYTIMILFQQVRQLVVLGSLLRGPILSALCNERKIPESVGTALKTLQRAIESNGDAASDESFLSMIKKCGMCKDIAKHDTSSLESHLKLM